MLIESLRSLRRACLSLSVLCLVVFVSTAFRERGFSEEALDEIDEILKFLEEDQIEKQLKEYQDKSASQAFRYPPLIYAPGYHSNLGAHGDKATEGKIDVKGVNWRIENISIDWSLPGILSSRDVDFHSLLEFWKFWDAIGARGRNQEIVFPRGLSETVTISAREGGELYHPIFATKEGCDFEEIQLVRLEQLIPPPIGTEGSWAEHASQKLKIVPANSPCVCGKLQCPEPDWAICGLFPNQMGREERVVAFGVCLKAEIQVQSLQDDLIARSDLGWTTGRSSQTFPNLAFYKDKTLSLERVRENIAQKSRVSNVALPGNFNIPTENIAPAGVFLIIILQLYILINLARVTELADHANADFWIYPWIPLFPGWVGRGVFLAQVLLAPFIATLASANFSESAFEAVLFPFFLLVVVVTGYRSLSWHGRLTSKRPTSKS